MILPLKLADLLNDSIVFLLILLPAIISFMILICINACIKVFIEKAFFFFFSLRQKFKFKENLETLILIWQL